MKTTLTWAESELFDQVNLEGFNDHEKEIVHINYDMDLKAILEVIGFKQGDRILLTRTEYNGMGDKFYKWAAKKDYYITQRLSYNIGSFTSDLCLKSITGEHRGYDPDNVDIFIGRDTIDSSIFKGPTYHDDSNSIIAEHIQDCVFLSIDVEYGVEKYKHTEFKTEYEAYYFLQSFLTPTLIMDNGYYLSAIYKLRERISYNEKADDIRRVSELLAIRAKQDPQNVYPFIRLPFSENNSIRKHVSMVNVAAYNPNCSYYFYELESYGKFEGNIL